MASPARDPLADWPDLSRALSDSIAFGSDFSLRLPASAAEPYRVVAFVGEESCNELFQFDIVFVTSPDTPRRPADQGPGVAAVLSIGHASTDSAAPARNVYGIINEIEWITSSSARHAYRARLVPTAWRLTQNRDARVFQDQTVVEIAATVLESRGIAFRRKLIRHYRKKAYCLQYQESDWSFVTRILAQEGVCFAFEHHNAEPDAAAGQREAGDSLLMFDTTHAYAPIAGKAELHHRPDSGSGMAQTENAVMRFHDVRRLAPTAATLRDADFQRAGRVAAKVIGTPAAGPDVAHIEGVLTAHQRHSGPHGGDEHMEIYNHHGQHTDVEVDAESTRILLEQHRVRSDEALGKTHCRRLLPAYHFTLTGMDVAQLNGDYVVSRIRHRGEDIGTDEQPRYQAEFRCLPADILARPADSGPRIMQVAETAIVVGPLHEEIHTDPYGRVKVQFQWDREGRHDDRSSCWLRVMQPWSGNGYGFQFVPRIGSEVIVSFLGGDIDRPVILGGLPNLANPLPHPPPLHQTRSAIRSRSTPKSSGYNEILFEDKKDHEVLSLHAQRNFERIVLHDYSSHIGHNRSERVDGNHALVVEQNHDTRINGDHALYISGASSHEVEGPVGFYHHQDAGGQIGGDAAIAIHKRADMTVGDALIITAGVNEQADVIVQTSNDIYLGATRNITLQAGDQLELRCGESRITMTPQTVTIFAQKVAIEADEQLSTGVGSSGLSINENVELVAKKVAVNSDGGELRLDANAWLNGGKVYLNCSAEQVSRSPDETTTDKGTVCFRIDPPAGEEGPFEVKIMTPSGEVVTRTAAAPDYEVKLEGRPGDLFSLVEVSLNGEVLESFEWEDG